MAYTGTIVAEAEMTFLAGEFVDATGNAEANHNYLAYYAEAYLCSILNYDIVANWAALDATKKRILTEYAGRYAAMTLIAYNMALWISGSSRIEAEDLINLHYARCQELDKLFKTADFKNWLGI